MITNEFITNIALEEQHCYLDVLFLKSFKNNIETDAK